MTGPDAPAPTDGETGQRASASPFWRFAARARRAPLDPAAAALPAGAGADLEAPVSLEAPDAVTGPEDHASVPAPTAPEREAVRRLPIARLTLTGLLMLGCWAVVFVELDHADAARAAGDLAASSRAADIARIAAAGALLFGAAGLAVVALSLARLRERERLDRAHTAHLNSLMQGRLEAVANRGNDIVALINNEGRLVWVSRSTNFPLTLVPNETLGRFFTDFIHAADRQRAGQAFAELLSKPGEQVTVKLRMWTMDGRLRPIVACGDNQLDDPAVEAIILHIEDVSEQTHLADQLDRLASRDPITGVANRAQLEDHLSRAIARRHERGGFAAVLLVDIDDFRSVADTLGHDAGDDLLRHAARRLERAAGDDALVARLDGDTFGVLLDNLRSVSEGRDRATAVLDGIRGTVTVAGSFPVELDAYGGLAFGAHDLPARELIRHADIALLEASRRSETGIASYTDQMQTRVTERVALTGQLRKATEREQFEVDYQPIVELDTGRVIAAEALVRWVHPDRGRLSPDAFVDLAERTGVIGKLGEQVLRQACTDAAAMLSGGATHLEYISVNLSPKQLDDPGLTDIVVSALADAGLPPERLLLELTESSISEDPERALARLRDLRSLGVRIALDDFGAGYSLVSFLEGYPLDVLKIDRSLVRNIGEQDDMAVLLSGLTQIGERHGLRVIAEGIETEAQRARAMELGIVYGQGYLFARPGAAAALRLS